MQMKQLCLFVFAANAMLQSAHAVDSLDLGKAEQLLRNGQSTAVYDALLADSHQRAGDPDFDYLFGLAALESGHPNIATLALERVLAVSPNHGAARLDMGRAYFSLGDMARALQEFDLAIRLNPPPAAVATIRRYQMEMAAREKAPTTRYTRYLEAGLGQDGNVTQGPNNNNTYLPAFGVSFIMNSANQKKRDEYSHLSAGLDVQHRRDGELSLFGRVDAKWRGYSLASGYDNASSDWRGGAEWKTNQDTWRAGVGFNNYVLAQQSYRNIYSMGGEFRRALSPRRQVMVFAQLAAVRYVPLGQVNNDTNQWVAGVGQTAQLSTGKATLVSASAYGGQELEANTATPRIDGDKHFLGIRVGAQIAWRSDLDIYATTGLQLAAYQRSNLLYKAMRQDELYEAAAGAIWRISPKWSLKPQLSWMHNYSNLSVNDYDRYEASVVVRTEF